MIFDEDEDEDLRVYARAKPRAVAQILAQVESAEELPRLAPDRQWSLTVQRSPSVAAILIRYALEMRQASLSLATFALHSAAVEALRECGAITPKLLLVSSSLASRDAQALSEARAWCPNLSLRKVHLKVAVLRSSCASLVVSGSANLSRNSGWERIDLSTSEHEADYWERELVRIAQTDEVRRRRA